MIFLSQTLSRRLGIVTRLYYHTCGSGMIRLICGICAGRPLLGTPTWHTLSRQRIVTPTHVVLVFTTTPTEGYPRYKSKVTLRNNLV
jgi:hypothetical protein